MARYIKEPAPSSYVHTDPLIVTVSGKITLDDRAAFILEHLTSYSLAEWFSSCCNSREVPLDQIKEGLSKLRAELQPILRARKAAIEAINKELRPTQS